MTECTPLDPRVTLALEWAKDYWYAIVVGALILVIMGLWSHGR